MSYFTYEREMEQKFTGDRKLTDTEIRRRINLSLRSRKKGPNAYAAFYTQKQREIALSMKKEGITVAKIAETIGCDITTIFHWMRQHRSGDVIITITE